jgi:hypothetical protein
LPVSSYFPLISILILLVDALIIGIIHQARPKFAYFWLVAALGALFAWPFVLFSRSSLPQTVPLVSWRPEEFFSSSPVLLVDHISWPFALALVTLVLSVILTDVARAAEADWSAWAGSLSLASLGMVAVQAGNPLTLVLAWAAIDLVELFILLGHLRSSVSRERLVVVFSARVGGIILLLWASMITQSSGLELTFASIPAQASVYLLLAAGLRLGVLPLHLPFLQEVPLRRGLGTILRLIPVAASLVLLARTATVGVPAILAPYLLALAGLSAIFAGFSWVIARDELDGRPFWILGLASLALASAIRGQSDASLAWGIALLLSGSLLFLLSARHRYLNIILLLGLLDISALPLTPTGRGALLYSPPFTMLLIVFLIAQSLFLLGYVRHALRSGESLVGVERWVWVIYPLGLILLPLASGFIAWGDGLDPIGQTVSSLDLIRIWPGIAAIGLALMVGYLARQRLPKSRISFGNLQKIGLILRSVFSFNWFYKILWRAYRSTGRLIAFINSVLEGEGGVLWTLLLLVLLLAFVAQTRRGQ